MKRISNLNLIRIRAIAKKEFIQIKHDPVSLALAFLMPLMLLLIFGYALNFDIKDVRTIVYDQSRSSESRDLIARFAESGYFKIVSYIENNAQIDDFLDSGKASVSISIPPDFSQKLNTNRPTEIGIIIDGSNANTATIVGGYVAAIAEIYIFTDNY